MTKEAPKSKFGEFLASKKIDVRRVLIASHDLEKLRPEDRAIRLAKRLRDPEAKKDEGEKKKPRSGRPVTPRAIDAALGGKSLTGPQKTRILKAVNKLLEQKKQPAVTLDALF